MSSYGFKAYDLSSEIYFTQFNNQYMIKHPVAKTIEYVRQIDMGVSYEKQYFEFILPAWIIRFFKENNLKFAFIPIAGYGNGGQNFKSLYTGIINYYQLYRDLDNWDWHSDIRFKVFIRPRSLSVYAQIIRRLGISDDRKADAQINITVLVGFR